MDKKHLKQKIIQYKKQLTELGFVAKKANEKSSNNSARIDVQHCLWILDELEVMIEVISFDRAMRDIGFVQGCLWCCGILKLEESHIDYQKERAA